MADNYTKDDLISDISDASDNYLRGKSSYGEYRSKTNTAVNKFIRTICTGEDLLMRLFVNSKIDESELVEMRKFIEVELTSRKRADHYRRTGEFLKEEESAN